jgi:hypothetical protein
VVGVSLLALAMAWSARQLVNLSLFARQVGGAIMPPGMIMERDTRAEAMLDTAAVDLREVTAGRIDRQLVVRLVLDFARRRRAAGSRAGLGPVRPISAQLAALMGGGITVDSEPGRGLRRARRTHGRAGCRSARRATQRRLR